MSSNNSNPDLARNEALVIGGIDALLGASLDDLDDLPSFDCPPPGVYICSLSMGEKEVNDNPAVEAGFTIVEVTELKDPTAPAPVAGSKFSTLFTLNPFGVGALKKLLVPFGSHFGTNNIGELVRERVQDVKCVVQVGNKKDKQDPDVVRPTVKILAVA